jgi:NDP-sugar pyrophosphorylase family protein
MHVGILAAGEGTRLQSVAPFKPLIRVGGIPLIERTLQMVAGEDVEKITIIFNELEKEMDLSQIPALRDRRVNYFFKSTPSSLHSLYEVMQRSTVAEDEHILFSMVDSILKPQDYFAFAKYCNSLGKGENAVLTTSYIEDEKPLTLSLEEGSDRVLQFQIPLDQARLITSGMYCFSGSALKYMQKCIDDGVMKMRNFLTFLVESGVTVRSFEVEKTLDIDRPEDIISAEKFLGLL